MAFSIDGVVIDRIQYGIAENSDGEALYTLTQLADASINITAESKDAVDAQGTLIKRFYTGKSGEFTANNAFVDFNILAAGTGSQKEVAAEGAAIEMPCFKTVKADKAGTKVENILKGYVADSMELLGIANNGSLVKTYKATEYSIADDDITLPAAEEGVAEFILKYKKKSSNGVKILNSADKFPKTIKLTLKALAID